MFWLGIFTVILGAISFSYIWKLIEKRNLPPGPMGWPVFGSVFNTIDDRVEYLLKLRATYGDFFSFYFGSKVVVMVCGYDNIKKYLVDRGNLFFDRPYFHLQQEMTQGFGLVPTSGEFAKKHRQLTIRLMTDPVYGLKYCEQKSVDGAERLVEEITKSCGKPLNSEDIMTAYLAQILCDVCLGSYHEMDDPKFQEYLYSFNEHFRNMKYIGFSFYCPWAKYLPFDLVKYRKSMESSEKLKRYFKEKMLDTERLYGDSPFPSFASVYLTELRKNEKDYLLKEEDFEKHLMSLILDVIGGGLCTTGSQLLWLVLCLVLHPDVQQRLQKEVKDVIGARKPLPEHVKHMPYSHAVIVEALRIGSVSPTAISHAPSRNCKIRDYDVPAGTITAPCIISAHLDAKVFPDPYEFRPERFLDEEGRLKMPEKYCPFGLSIRSCVGLQLGETVLFLTLTNLMQNFTLKLAETDRYPKPNLKKGCWEITRSPMKYNFIAVPHGK